METENHSLEQFETTTLKRSWQFLMISGLSVLSSIVSLLLHLYDNRVYDSITIAPNTIKTIIISQACLLTVTILFALRKKLGWVFMTILSSVFVVVIVKYFLKLILNEAYANLYQTSLLTRGVFFLLNSSAVLFLLFNKSLLKYLAISKKTIIVTIILGLFISFLIAIA